ncbi:MAG TPA: alpha/beta fold hydrolase [Steroidobacteraceae bacterium]|nr:alpha/beta fold hydrolase [Steroidobacteraceae bacterium]
MSDIRQPTMSRVAASFLGTALLAATAARSAAADTPPMPHSLAEAIKMERQDALPRTAFYDTPALSGSKPGALLEQETFTGYAVPAGAKAVRVLYHSLSGAGTDVATSAVVLIPPGRPPAGGWPVIAWAHGTSGVARMCAPSLEKDMEYGEEGLMPMVRAGFAVVATDYHGLGTVGPHEYVNKIAQGRDVIYSVPAARAAVPSLSRRWVVIGHSQGGLAAWSVAEMEAKLQDPDYLGAVSVAGAGDLKTILTGMGDPGSEAAFDLTYMAYAIHVLSPDFKPSDMLVGDALARYSDATRKGCWNYTYASFLDLPPGKIVKSGWDKTAASERFFTNAELGTAPVRGPLLVIAGEGDQTVPIATVRATVHKACRNGIALTFRSYPGLDHDPTMAQSTPDQLAWVRDRFSGKPSADHCADLPPP